MQLEFDPHEIELRYKLQLTVHALLNQIQLFKFGFATLVGTHDACVDKLLHVLMQFETLQKHGTIDIEGLLQSPLLVKELHE
jgi:hypothetical protein